MKLKLRKWNVLLGTCMLCLLLAGSAGNVHAMAYSTSTSIIDWSSLTISHSTGADSFTVSQIDGFDWYGTYNSESYAGAETDVVPYDWDYDYPWEYDYGWTDTNASFLLTNASAHGWTTADVLGETVSATADGIDTYYAYAYARASHMGTITAINAGTITISVNYSIDQTLTTDSALEYAYGWTLADLWIEKEFYLDDDEDDWDFFEIDNDATGTEVYSDSFEGTLSVSLYFEAGETGLFDSYVENEAGAVTAVPEPATMLLLGSGLLGLAGFRKKFRRV